MRYFCMHALFSFSLAVFRCFLFVVLSVCRSLSLVALFLVLSSPSFARFFFLLFFCPSYNSFRTDLVLNRSAVLAFFRRAAVGALPPPARAADGGWGLCRQCMEKQPSAFFAQARSPGFAWRQRRRHVRLGGWAPGRAAPVSGGGSGVGATANGIVRGARERENSDKNTDNK